MKYTNKLSSIVGSAINSSVNKEAYNKKMAKMVASEVEESMQISVPQVGETPERVQYYLERAVQEVSNALADINFELSNILMGEEHEILDITSDSAGTTQVVVLKPFKIEDIRDISNAKNALSKLKIGEKFAKYVAVEVTPNSDLLAVKLTISLPKEYVDYIGGDDYRKRAAAVDKAISKTIDTFLDK